MCGIAGQFRRDGQSLTPGWLPAALEAMRARGPDESGLVEMGPVSLGCARLAVVGATDGSQPLTNHERTLFLVGNGEVYNSPELRQRFQRNGHRFLTSSDLEVILALYEERGAAFADELIGMFALALWDERRQRLLLARDGSGMKPLYFKWDGPQLSFASQLRPIQARSQVEPSALMEYLQLGYVSEGRCLAAGVEKLPAGEVLQISATALERRRIRLPAPPSESLQEVLRQSVEICLRADQRPGLWLSGGLDSSALAALSPHPLASFSAQFREARFDEGEFRRRLPPALTPKHREILIGPQQAAQATLALPDALDEPLADAAALPTWWLCRSARPDFKAVLSGAGADELLGGYPWHAQPTHSPHQSARALFQPDQLAWLTRSPELRQYLLPTKVLRGQEIERFDQDVYLVSDILTLTDRVAMAHGLEVRLPYLNGPFIACCRHLEGPLRSHKLGLRKALQGLLPEAILGRKKQGFVPPLEDWMWQEGPLRQAVLAPLEEPQLVEQGWLEAGAIRRLLEEHDRRLAQHGRRLWGLYLLEMWLRQNTS